MSCSLELPFCQGPYAKLQLESQRESLAPGSPLWSGIGGSHTCQHKTLEHPYDHMCGLESLCSMFDKGCGQEKPGPTPQEFCFGSHDVVN